MWYNLFCGLFGIACRQEGNEKGLRGDCLVAAKSCGEVSFPWRTIAGSGESSLWHLLPGEFPKKREEICTQTEGWRSLVIWTEVRGKKNVVGSWEWEQPTTACWDVKEPELCWDWTPAAPQMLSEGAPDRCGFCLAAPGMEKAALAARAGRDGVVKCFPSVQRGHKLSLAVAVPEHPTGTGVRCASELSLGYVKSDFGSVSGSTWPTPT